MAHDFKKFPELTNEQMELYYWDSPHRQITEDFTARVERVHDGDTITVRWSERNFPFPIRFIKSNAPELKDPGGKESQQWLEQQLLGRMVEIVINRERRVDKWGRLLGDVFHSGIEMAELSIMTGHATPFELRREGGIPSIEKLLAEKKI